MNEHDKKLILAVITTDRREVAAEQLGMQPVDLSRNLWRIYRQLKVANRDGLIRWAVDNELVSEDHINPQSYCGCDPKPPTLDEIQQRMAQTLRADSLRYLPIDALARAIDLPPDVLCQGCVTGKYPTPMGRQLYQIALKQKDAEPSGRTYEMAGVGSKTP